MTCLRYFFKSMKMTFLGTGLRLKTYLMYVFIKFHKNCQIPTLSTQKIQTHKSVHDICVLFKIYSVVFKIQRWDLNANTCLSCCRKSGAQFLVLKSVYMLLPYKQKCWEKFTGTENTLLRP